MRHARDPSVDALALGARPPSADRLVDRSKVVAALAAGGQHFRSARVAACGTVRVAVDTDGRWTTAPAWCRDRMCPRCARARSASVAAALRGALLNDARTAERCAFVTLTRPRRRRDGELLGDALADVAAAWRRVWAARRGSRLRDAAHAWVCSVEACPPERGYAWHVHRHVVVHARDGVDPTAAGEALAAAWMVAVPGSTREAQDVRVVDARRIGQLSKYPVKPLRWDITPASMRELAVYMHGRRMFDAGLAWRGAVRAWLWATRGDVTVAALGPRLVDVARSGDDVDVVASRLRAPRDATGRRVVGPCALVSAASTRRDVVELVADTRACDAERRAYDVARRLELGADPESDEELDAGVD